MKTVSCCFTIRKKVEGITTYSESINFVFVTKHNIDFGLELKFGK